ncbi:hypothetical protein B0H13DRAFT_2271205 [Mycena leptocephala]|nr:hypothetical protein B0H13DRAFT_2271205 [Mycena leptocephala]
MNLQIIPEIRTLACHSRISMNQMRFSVAQMLGLMLTPQNRVLGPSEDEYLSWGEDFTVVNAKEGSNGSTDSDSTLHHLRAENLKIFGTYDLTSVLLHYLTVLSE